MRLLKNLTAASMLAATAVPAAAADFEVHMMNKGADGVMVFEPALTKIKPGDTVTFVPMDKGHNAETVKDMIPEGAEAFKSKVNENLKQTFTVPGAYVIKCTPHFSMGMVEVVVVGDTPANLEAIKSGKLPNKARERVDKALSQL
ncbi:MULTISPECIES: pseudoazurin [unclassified Rhizobium]|uniref:pseudoazurin n=1 Tax=unclassified Rhizobium TaxID=2613769 RepID=UPI00146F47B9|nr:MULTISPECIES: pseudoazurin [unclassified Rhizobium]MBD9448636.1 pseudoazurin [Rhizobium sp. RHZ01]MBD9454701.1 pseudoazurin [Rhizobium sp. RHZ02]NMN70909.1 pseudoazurin [Rhizobium sp. 57MFTsu3.2]